MTNSATINPFFDPKTGTVTYVVADQATGHAAIIDPVLDFDFKSGRTSTASAEVMRNHVWSNTLTIDWILETHAHADHVSAAPYLKSQVGGRIAIGENICAVQATFKKVFNLEDSFRIDGSAFDHLFADGEVFQIGTLQATALLMSGHTPADMAYQITDAVFVGDTMFMPDVGTARADFPGGDAHALYRSIHRLLALPPETRLFVCHDYPPASRAPAWETTVGEQRASNIHLKDSVTEIDFVTMRQARDTTLAIPTLIIRSIQINIRGGMLPPAEVNGVSYLKVPVNVLGHSSE